MKDFLKGALMMGGMLALVLVVRIAAFVPLHIETAAATDPAPNAAAGSGCGVMAVKMPCFREASPEHRDKASAPLQRGPADAATIASQDLRCAAQQAKFPCLHHKDPRS
jgi:hypothetical protein